MFKKSPSKSLGSSSSKIECVIKVDVSSSSSPSSSSAKKVGAGTTFSRKSRGRRAPRIGGTARRWWCRCPHRTYSWTHQFLYTPPPKGVVKQKEAGKILYTLLMNNNNGEKRNTNAFLSDLRSQSCVPPRVVSTPTLLFFDKKNDSLFP